MEKVLHSKLWNKIGNAYQTLDKFTVNVSLIVCQPRQEKKKKKETRVQQSAESNAFQIPLNVMKIQMHCSW